MPWPATTRPRRRRAGVEQRASGVVLESGHHRRDAVAEVGLEQHVTDQPLLARERLVGEDSCARHPRAVAAAVAPPEQLVAATDGQHRGAGVDGSAQVVSPCRQVGRDERLLTVLAATDVDEVVRPRLERVTGLDARHLERMPSECSAPREHGDVAAVGIDVEVVRIEVGDRDPHDASSQYGRTRPRETAIWRSWSIAV